MRTRGLENGPRAARRIAGSAAILLMLTACGPQPEGTVLAIAPERLVLPDARVGGSSETTFVVLNVHTASVNLARLRIEGDDFVLPDATSSLGAGERRRLTVRFEPSVPGPAWARLVLEDAEGALDVPLEGYALAAPTCDDGNPCTHDAWDPDAEACRHKNRTGACDDGDPCTTEDRCILGRCSSTPRVCDDGNPCTADACRPGEGCAFEPAMEGLACGPPGACTLPTCRSGACVDEPLPDGASCGAGEQCRPRVCLDGACETQSAPDGHPCDDDNRCTVADACLDGVCGGAPRQCEDGSPCTTGRCEPATGCVYEPANEGVACELTLLCPSDAQCTGDPVCREGRCLRPPVRVGLPCDDGDACTVGEMCTTTGACRAAETVTCSDGDTCTLDWCDPATGCMNEAAPDGTRCDLGTSCETAATCVGGACSVSSPVPDGTRCDDGALCTVGDACVAGTCVGDPAGADRRGVLGWAPTWQGREGKAVLSGGRLLLADPGRLTVVDASTSPAVVLTTKAGEAAFDQAAEIDLDRVVISSTLRAGHNPPGALLRLIDLRPGRPLEVDRLELPSLAWWMAAGRGRILLRTGASEFGPELLHLYEVGDAGLREVGSRAWEEGWDAPRAVIGDALILSSGPRLLIVDLTDPGDLAVLAVLETAPHPELARNPATGELLVLSDEGLLTTWDLDDPRRPVQSRRLAVPECEGMSMSLAASERYVGLSCFLQVGMDEFLGDTLILDAHNLEVVSRLGRPPRAIAGFLDPEHGVLRWEYWAGPELRRGVSIVHAATGTPLGEWSDFFSQDTIPVPPDDGFTWWHDWTLEDGFMVPPPSDTAHPPAYRWQPCPAAFPPVDGGGAGLAGPLARHGAQVRSNARPVRLAADLTPSLGPDHLLPTADVLYSPRLAGGPLVAMTEEGYELAGPYDGRYLILGKGILDLDTDQRDHFGVMLAYATRHGGGPLAAAGPHLIAPWVEYDYPSNESNRLVVEVYDAEALFGEYPTEPTGRLYVTRAGCEPTSAATAWTSPEGDTASVSAECQRGGRLELLLDTTVPSNPVVVWEALQPETAPPLVALRLLDDLLVSLRGTGQDAQVTLHQVDRTTLPWRLTPLAEASTPEADRLLAFDGEVAVVGGPAPEGGQPGAQGIAWIVPFAEDLPPAWPVPTPHPPRWALPTSDGLLFSSEEGVGTLGLSCQ